MQVGAYTASKTVARTSFDIVIAYYAAEDSYKLLQQRSSSTSDSVAGDFLFLLYAQFLCWTLWLGVKCCLCFQNMSEALASCCGGGGPCANFAFESCPHAMAGG